jgi:hypothetical protein
VLTGDTLRRLAVIGGAVLLGICVVIAVHQAATDPGSPPPDTTIEFTTTESPNQDPVTGEAAQPDPNDPNRYTNGQCINDKLPPCNANVYVGLHLSPDDPVGEARAFTLKWGASPQPDDRFHIYRSDAWWSGGGGTATVKWYTTDTDAQWYAAYLVQPADPADGPNAEAKLHKILLQPGHAYRVNDPSSRAVDVGESEDDTLTLTFDPSVFPDVAVYGFDPNGPQPGIMIDEAGDRVIIR